MSETITGWLLDLHAAPEGGLALWLLSDDGQRRRLWQDFPVTFYAAGADEDLRQLWRYLASQPERPRLGRTERRELFHPQPLTVLSAQVRQPGDLPGLFGRVARQFPALTYFDADLSLPLQHAARFGTFPLARCRVQADGERVRTIEPLDSPWELDPQPAPLRILSIEPDQSPRYAPPQSLRLQVQAPERARPVHYHLPLDPPRPLLVNLAAILRRHDPDLILSAWGDTWLFAHLQRLAQRYKVALPLNRQADAPLVQRKARSYFSYGRVIYMGAQFLLLGRWHIDIYNAMLFHDYGLDGMLEMARVTGLPVQTAARASPGSGISAMQIITALRQEVLVPWRKQQPEDLKSALDLLRADQGGLIYQPVTGLHPDVAEIDFVSMYPSVMVHFNISPETAVQSPTPEQRAAQPGLRQVPELDLWIDESRPGLVPVTLQPLLSKRIRLKGCLAELPAWEPRRARYKAMASAHKWLLVTCFGYLGYKNARFGRIEAHEAVTAYGRETLLRAKEAAEDLGCRVLHMYVDGMWVQRPGARTPADFRPVLDEIVTRSGLPVALEGIYRWVAFLPSRLDARIPVPNRYFGVFQDGSLKYRGIEARRGDTPPFIVKAQLAVLESLAQAPEAAALPTCLPQIVQDLRATLAALRAGRLPLPDLLASQKLSRRLDEYRSPSPVARAVQQLQGVAKPVEPGQHVRFLYTLGNPGVHAWDLAAPPPVASLDVARYSELLLRAVHTVLQPLGVDAARLRDWIYANAGYGAPPGLLPPRGDSLPLLAVSRSAGLPGAAGRASPPHGAGAG